MKRVIPLLIASLTLAATPQWVQAQSLNTMPAAQPAAQTTAQLSTIATDFVSLLAEGQFSDALQWYDAAISGDVSTDSLSQTWQDIETANGSLRRQINSQTLSLNSADGSYAVIVTCEFDQGVRDLLVTFAGNQVVSFAIVES
ncbi:MAG: hypothetical protein Kow00121_56940 [Elainellaceae cyanobacterium]